MAKLTEAQKIALEKFSQPGGHGFGEFAYLSRATAMSLWRNGLIKVGLSGSPSNRHSTGIVTEAGIAALNAVSIVQRHPERTSMVHLPYAWSEWPVWHDALAKNRVDVRDSSGVRARPRTLAAAHRATRRRDMAGTRVQKRKRVTKAVAKEIANTYQSSLRSCLDDGYEATHAVSSARQNTLDTFVAEGGYDFEQVLLNIPDESPNMAGTKVACGGFRRFGAREDASPGHVCQECRAQATHVRRDCLVGGGHRRNVYYCEAHDYPGASDGDANMAGTRVATSASRPKDPSRISFDRRCFEQVGVKTYWLGTTKAPAYPPRFDDEKSALAWHSRTGRPITRHEEPVMRRIAWTIEECA